MANLLAGRATKVSASTLRELLANEPRLAEFVHVVSGQSSFEVVPPLREESSATAGPPGAADPDLARLLPDLRAVVARHDRTATRRSAMARLLRRPDLRLDIDRDDALARAARLDGLVTAWLRQRLWSINLAPELVAHDERHVAAVEDLITGLAAPFIAGTPSLRLTALEAEWLAVAAWLHDWGHVGGPVAPFQLGGRYPVVAGSRNVRLLHGLISQQLLGEHWRGMHHLPPDIAQPAAVLCGHHQSWTSFGAETPGPTTNAPSSELSPPELLASLGVHPKSLNDDLQAISDWLPAHVGPHRFKLLVALLRVADAADVGRHRVSDIGAARQSFLARCLHWEALRTVSELGRRPHNVFTAPAGIDIAMGVAIEALNAATARDFEHHLSEIVDCGIPEIVELRRYADFVRSQESHFNKHQLVNATRFEYSNGSFNIVVVPAEKPDGAVQVKEAVTAVAGDVRRELHKAQVGQILEDFGVRIRRAYSAPFSAQEEYSMEI